VVLLAADKEHNYLRN